MKVVDVVSEENEQKHIKLLRTQNDPDKRYIMTRFLRNILKVKAKALTYQSLFEQEISFN